ncbi:hypothetical protein DNTS_020593 [Danionella cerebrum]|uniref:Ras-associating domain-containing protein n=1 Tax=Danionella cerebrum TaxID=2873325 RepID=A0A553R541_9TELE|nr:hypothetical protein DNTS_020593 [Danionella translucida]
MGKWELTMDPVQEWGEEKEDGAVFGVTLRREPVPHSSEPSEAFVQYRTCKVRRLKAGTLQRLISHLLEPSGQEPEYARILLGTYHSFTSTSTLIQMLLHRDNLASALNRINYPESSLWRVLELWLEEYCDDFRESPMHPSLRFMCLQLRGHPALFPLARQYEALLKRFQTEDVLAAASADQPDSALGKETQSMSDFMDFSIVDIAEQLTWMDVELFMKVVPFQCLGCVWSQRDKKENLSPTIWATIAQFNAVTNRVITSLLSPSSSTTSQRSRVIEKWVRVAKNLCETFPDENSVVTGREIFVGSSAGGTVPYLGTYLTALTMLDTALADSLEGGLINFEKRRREYEILRQIRQLQASCSQYALVYHPSITAWLQSHKLLSDQESYELSTQLETPQDSSSPSSSVWSHRNLSKKLSSLLSGNEGSRKNADQISVSSSGSSSSEIEEISSQTFTSPSHSSCGPNFEAFPSSSAPDSPVISSSSSSSQQDLSRSPSSSSSYSAALAEHPTASTHKRSVSMSSLPFYNRQVDDSCIIRLTSQDKTAQVIQRVLLKHNLEGFCGDDFTLVQVLAQGRELQIPDKANVFYAMSSSANYDFVLRRCSKGQRKQLKRSISLSSGRGTK